jgi:FKBP-type peptidyl-prolyl cis-trans isomerase
MSKEVMSKPLVVIAFALLALSGSAQAASQLLSPQANAAYLAQNAKLRGTVTRPDGLQYRIIQNGSGPHPTLNDTVEVYYTGKLINGEVFDGTEEGFPHRFLVKELIPGWKEALLIMREGDHWQLVIPSSLGYGTSGSSDGAIPPGQSLVFDLQLLTVVKKSDKELEEEAAEKAQEEEKQAHQGPGAE